MEFVVKRETLLRELQHVQGVVERRTTVPILANILLESDGDTVRLTATDLDVTVQCACAAQVSGDGAAAVPARKLFDLVRLFPDGDVHCNATEPDWMKIRCGRSRIKISSLSRDNFPDVPAAGPTTLTLPAQDLGYMAAHCLFAITQEESRYTLNGALMILSPESMSFVTTDGHRLVLIRRDVKIEGLESETRTLVPKKALVEFQRLVSDDLVSVEFGQEERNLFFQVGSRLLISRILTGQFPNFEMVVPKGNDRKVVLETLEFIDALKRVNVMADEQSHAVRLAAKQGQVDLSSATSAEFGEASDSLVADYQGDPIKIGFNAQYLLEFLAGLESQQVSLELADADTPGLLKPHGEEKFDYRYVVMPLKV